MAGYPEGITAKNAHEAPAPSLIARAVPLVLLGGLLALALTGLLGGTANPRREASGPQGTLAVEAPEILRNGEFFEIRIRLTANAPLADATLAIEESYLRDVTVNTTIPAAETEEAKDGVFTFAYGPLDRGESIDVKLDGQINPPLFGGTSGAVSFADGEETLASIPLALTVLP